jgi:hypothetical protein
LSSSESEKERDDDKLGMRDAWCFDVAAAGGLATGETTLRASLPPEFAVPKLERSESLSSEEARRFGVFTPSSSVNSIKLVGLPDLGRSFRSARFSGVIIDPSELRLALSESTPLWISGEKLTLMGLECLLSLPDM